MTMRNAEEIVASRHSLDNVQYMVHRVAPALWTKNLYFCNREQAYSLDNAEKEQ